MKGILLHNGFFYVSDLLPYIDNIEKLRTGNLTAYYLSLKLEPALNQEQAESIRNEVLRIKDLNDELFRD